MPYRKYRRNRRMNRRRRVNRGYRRGGRRKTNMNKIASMTSRDPGVIVADRYFVKLNWTDTTNYLLSSSGVDFGFIGYRANMAYDPLSSLSTRYPAGFTQMAGLYYTYRVRACKIRISCSNLEAFPVNVIVWPSLENLAGLVGTNYLQSIMSNPYAKYRTLSAKGGMDRIVIKNYLSSVKAFGTNAAKYDLDYAGSTTSAVTTNQPEALWYWNVGCYPLNFATFTSASVAFDCRLTYYTEFFDRRPILQTLLGAEENEVIEDDPTPGSK